MWDLLWTMWHWNRLFSKYFGISAAFVIPPIFHNRISDEAVCLVPSYWFPNKALGFVVGYWDQHRKKNRRFN
jgi:hypothetical protein